MALSAKVKKSGNVVRIPLVRKKGSKKRFRFKPSGPLIILLFLLGFIFYSLGGQIIEMYNVRDEIRSIQQQMDELQEKNAALNKELEQLNSPVHIEREAREKLGLVKPGEKIILEAKPGEKGSIIPDAAKNPEKIETH